MIKDDISCETGLPGQALAGIMAHDNVGNIPDEDVGGVPIFAQMV